jgi:hypothetical protein
MYFDTSLKTSRRDCSGISCPTLVKQFRHFFFPQEIFFGQREEMDGRDGTREDTQDTTRIVEIEKVNRVIRALLFVTKLSPVDAHKDKETEWGVTLKCASCPGCCGKRQEAPVQLSRDHKTELACLQELLKRLQDRHVECAQAVTNKADADAQADATVNPDTPNVLQAMMKLEQAKARAKTVNKVALEAEKEKDTAERVVEELKRQLQPNRARTDDDAGDSHDLLAKFDNCDLNNHRREGTRVQNRRNVQVGSRDNQQKPHTGKDGFLYHTCLGLVGWISYW